MNTTNMPSFEELLDWVEGRLSPQAAAQLEAQAANFDSATQKSLNWLRAFHQRADNTVLEAPPATLHQSVIGAFKTQQLQARLQKFIAKLLPSAGPRLATAGMRGVNVQAQRRQISYETEVADIVLNVQPQTQRQPPGFTISGQIFPRGMQSSEGMAAQLLRDNTEYGLTMTDSFGEFAFEAISPGHYDMVLSNDRFEIHIPMLDISQ